jgi:hypothetical protein
MNEEEYQKIYKNIRKNKDFIIENGILFKKQNDRKLRVIRDFEKEGLMYIMHDHELSAHFGIKATYDKIREKFGKTC